MEYTITEVETLVRNLLGEIAKTQSPGDIFTYGSSSVFTLTENNVVEILSVLINDVEIGESEYSYNTSNNKVTITASLVAGDTVEIQYTFYPNYSSTEIQNFIKAATIHISACNYTTFVIENDIIYPSPTREEENLIAMVAAILINPDNTSYSLPDIRVTAPKDLPTIEKIRKIIGVFKTNKSGEFFIG